MDPTNERAAHLPGVDEGEEGGEAPASQPTEVEAEGTGGELGQDGGQLLTPRGENHLVSRVTGPVLTEQGHIAKLTAAS